MLTARLVLRPPVGDDAEVDQLHAIHADPATWTHFPCARFTDVEKTRAAVGRWREGWSTYWLGPWLVRLRGDGSVIGNAGVELRDDRSWNLGHRFDTAAWGHGYAAEACRPALTEARRVRPELPVVAHLLEHNHASARLAEQLDLALVHRGPDAGNPDPGAVRLVHADRPHDALTLAATMR